MRVSTPFILTIALCSLSAVANVSVTPPPNNETIVGVWEGLLRYPPWPITLFRMQIQASGDSYLVQITPGAAVDRAPGYIVYKLERADSKVAVGETATLDSTDNGVSLKMTGTPFNLHFHQITPGPGIHDFWIKGIGVASPDQDFGLIKCTNLGEGIWL